MDNPCYFTVLWRAEDTVWDMTDAGLFGSLRSAGDEASKRLANTDVPDMEFAVAVAALLGQDPAPGRRWAVLIRLTPPATP